MNYKAVAHTFTIDEIELDIDQQEGQDFLEALIDHIPYDCRYVSVRNGSPETGFNIHVKPACVLTRGFLTNGGHAVLHQELNEHKFDNGKNKQKKNQFSEKDTGKLWSKAYGELTSKNGQYIVLNKKKEFIIAGESDLVLTKKGDLVPMQKYILAQ